MGCSRGRRAIMRAVRVAALGGASLALAHCSGNLGRIDPRFGVAASPRVVPLGERAPKGGGVYRAGSPYMIAGRTYYPKTDPIGYKAVGYASWYGDDFHGRYTANGEIFDEQSISAASPDLPMPCYARVTNLANHRSIIVRVNDRGPFAPNRVLDVSRKTAKLLGFYDRGLAKVKVEYVGRAPLSGSSDVKLAATLREHGPAEGSPVRVASAGPYVPGYFDSRPTQEVLPPERPYGRDLVREPAEAEAPPVRYDTREPTATTRTASLDSIKHVPAPLAEPHVSPVSAYAPVDSRGRAAGFMSGRGLY